VTPEEKIAKWTEVKRAYQLVFNSPAGAEVLADMEYFWRANCSCVAIGPGKPVDLHLTFVLEGRREVYLRVRERLDLTPEELSERDPTPAIGAQGNELP
jgi:hypothetical protein